MSRADARSEIEGEYQDAKKTARAYLQAVGTLGPWIEATDYRERQTRAIRHAMLESWTAEGDLPDDPIARYAAVLGIRYLHEGYDSEILDTLLERDRSHPAYREVLTIIVCEMRTRNLDIPERVWTPPLMQAVFGRLGACGQVLSCVRPLYAADDTPRARMEIRGLGPNRLRELESSPFGCWFSQPGLVDLCPYLSSVLPTSPTASRTSPFSQAVAGAR